MNIKRILKSKIVMQWGILVLILSILLSSIVVSFAWFNPVFKVDVWSGLDTSLPNISSAYKETDTLPMDMLFGTTKPLVRYVGEVNKEDASKINNGNVPFREENPDGKAYVDEMASIDDKAKPEDFTVPGTDLFNARIYILSKAEGSTVLKLIGDGVTGIIKGVTKLISQLDNFLIQAKNINATKILEALKLEKLLKIINKIFVKGDDGTWSVFFILALISFIFCLVGVAWRYLTGKGKTQSFRELVIALAIGLALLFASYSNAATVLTLSDKLALAVDNLIVQSNQSGSTPTDWYTVEIKNNKTETLSLRETSTLNKMLIDAQLNNQFNGSSLVNNDTLWSGIKTKVDDANEFSTLGQWFWVADSPVKIATTDVRKGTQKNVLNQTVVAKETQVARMDSLIDALQDKYPKGNNKEVIKIYDGFANPSSWRGILDYILLQVIFVLLFMCLWRLVLRILTGKMLAGAFWIGLPAAGVLYISGRKKLIEKGKMIAFIGLTSAIQVFTFSVVFDLVLIITGILVGSTNGEVWGYLLVIAFLLLVLRFLTTIIRTLDKFLDSISQALSPDLNRTSKALKAQARRGINAFNRWNDDRDKDAFVDDGNGGVQRIKVKNKGGFTSMFGHAIEEGFSESANRKGLIKIGREGYQQRKDAKTTALRELARTVAQENQNKISDLEQDMELLKSSAYVNPDATDEERYEGLKEDLSAIGINPNGKDEEREKYEEIKNHKQKIQNIEDELLQKEDRAAYLRSKGLRTAEESAELKETEERIKELKENKAEEISEILRKVDEKINETFQKSNDKILGDLFSGLTLEKYRLEFLLKNSKNLTEEDIRKIAEDLALVTKKQKAFVAGHKEMDKLPEIFAMQLSTTEKLKAHNEALDTYETNKAYNNQLIENTHKEKRDRNTREAFEENLKEAEKRAAEEAERYRIGSEEYRKEMRSKNSAFSSSVQDVVNARAKELAELGKKDIQSDVELHQKDQLSRDMARAALLIKEKNFTTANDILENLPEELRGFVERGGKETGGVNTSFSNMLDKYNPQNGSSIQDQARMTEILEHEAKEYLENSSLGSRVFHEKVSEEVNARVLEETQKHKDEIMSNMRGLDIRGESVRLVGSSEEAQHSLEYFASIGGGQAVDDLTKSLSNETYQSDDIVQIANAVRTSLGLDKVINAAPSQPQGTGNGQVNLQDADINRILEEAEKRGFSGGANSGIQKVDTDAIIRDTKRQVEESIRVNPPEIDMDSILAGVENSGVGGKTIVETKTETIVEKEISTQTPKDIKDNIDKAVKEVQPLKQPSEKKKNFKLFGK